MNPQPRGRPRCFDMEHALDKALELFWEHGFEATSLDAISAATGIARPSLALAFGDKEQLYIKAMELSARRMGSILDEALASSAPLAEVLEEVFAKSLDTYLSGECCRRGCMVFSTAPGPAAKHPAIAAALSRIMREGDKAMEQLFHRARDRGEIACDDLDTRAMIASATLHALAMRARAGEPVEQLKSLAAGAARLLASGAR